ncbi:hypothetical protein PFLA_a3400 [Pseudoalteromonas flavipulchra NCIMB 2033 = ATCC BAA-314]|nr:hypothetical protein [Pseudoalteromonas flavipulchra NCIMB 2033 = ATCC BAA-314]
MWLKETHEQQDTTANLNIFQSIHGCYFDHKMETYLLL